MSNYNYGHVGTQRDATAKNVGSWAGWVIPDEMGEQVFWHGYRLQVLAMANGQPLAHVFQQNFLAARLKTAVISLLRVRLPSCPPNDKKGQILCKNLS
ncbi:MAG: hypothetical protein Q4A69_06600 [Moraxella sp.]|nr:hypothetical protein [Moraxella sp.]